ncbi:MAG: hypothetical protein Q8N51_08460 [Gammaproteobacteria bacterium]|nr:hypothetical protein [Gammaproteobacteria bacterium]
MKQILAVFATVVLLALGAAFSGGQRANADATVDAELTEAIMKLSGEQKAALLVLVKGIVDAEHSESPEAGAMKTVAAYVKAAEAADLDTLMAQISENFNHYEVGNQSGYRAFLEQVKGEGMLEDIAGDLEHAEAALEGEIVTVYPVELEGIFGTVTMEFELKNEDGTWRIVGMDMTGV